MNAATLQGVSLGFANRPVLTGIDLTLRHREFIGVLGPNGSGKTTLMRALLGLVRPTTGSIEVLGTPAQPGHEHVGYLPQTRAEPWPAIRGRDLLAASLHGTRWGASRTSTATSHEIDRVLHAVGATALANRPITALSGGERQRVLIAQSLLGEPRLLLLDEPLSGLDPAHQSSVVALLRDLQQSLGLTVLCSAHDLNMLLPVMDRVLFLAGGHAALGTPDEVVTEPVLSRLYGAPMKVIKTGHHLFVVQ